MSVQPPPKNQGANFNSAAFPGGSGQTVNFPLAQGTLTLAQGVIWGDGTFQNSASGGGGSGVQNPMTADLDGGGFSITNVDTFSGIFGTFSEVTSETMNDSATVIYRNKGAVVAGNYYNVGEGLVMTDAEASCIVVSRCLDPGFKQTMVVHVSMFNAKAHLNLISNALESDTPIFTLVSAGDDGLGVGGFSFFCNQNSATWEYRVYRQQDDKGTGTYPANSYFNFSAGGSVPTSSWTVTYAELDTSAHASAAVSGSFLAKTSLTSATLQTDTAVATVSLSTNRVNTDELNNNGGTGLVDVITPLRMNNNDIQSAGIIGANAYYTGGPSILPLGAPGGPLYLDTVNNRVGVNVAAPQEDLEIDGNIQLDSAGANKIKFYDGTASTERAEIDAAASGTGGQLVFYTKEDPGAVTAKMTIQADGRVTIANRIEGLPNPVAATDAANKQYVDSSIPSLTGYVQNPMTVDLDAAGFKITNLADPTAAQDAATKSYVDSAVVPPSGYVTNPMTANLNGGVFSITNTASVTALNNLEATNGTVTAGFSVTAGDSIYAGNALVAPVQAPIDVQLPFQSVLGTGVMPRWFGGYLFPQSMSSSCPVSENVPPSANNKLNINAPPTVSVGAYDLTVNTGAVGTNLIITIPPALNNHTFNIQVDGEWTYDAQGGNGDGYIYIRKDAFASGQPIIGMNTGQVIDGSRYITCLNYTGILEEGDYAILVGHWNLSPPTGTNPFNGTFSIRYLGAF